MIHFLYTILDIVGEMSPYLLLGFFIAGLLQAFVPSRLYSRHFSSPTMSSVVKATLMGVPLPLCSCGVIPTAVALRRKGASKGASIGFLISTPQTGVDSILATYSLLGTAMAVLRPLVAIVTALFGGWLTNRTDSDAKSNIQSEQDGTVATEEEPKSLTSRIIYALRYGFVDMIADVGKWLVIGLLIAAVITVAIPDSWFSLFAQSPWFSYLLVLLLTIPMYVCATGSIPIAVSLLMKGLSPGSAIIFLMVGPATNAASLLVVDKVMGRRTTVAYLVSIMIGAVLAAVCIDYLMPASWFAMTSPMHHGACCHDEGLSWIQILSTVVFALLLINAFVAGRHHHHHHSVEDEQALNSAGNDNNACMVFNVKGMNCTHCQQSVCNAIKGVEGVSDVDVSLSDAQAVVKGNAAAEDIIKAVEQIGYDCSIKS